MPKRRLRALREPGCLTAIKAAASKHYNSEEDVPHLCRWGANIITGGEHISPASLKRQEEVLPTAKLEQRRYNMIFVKRVKFYITAVLLGGLSSPPYFMANFSCRVCRKSWEALENT
jgi:hypothetical protein